MLIELLDIVDEEDQVIGEATRAEIHRKHLNHRAIHVLIFNSQNFVFLQLRSSKKDCFPNCWDSSAAGHVNSRENYADCARREIYEELGVHMDFLPDPLFKLPPSPENGFEFVHVFQIYHNGPFVLDPAETSRGLWIAPLELDQWLSNQPTDFAGGFAEMWKGVKKFNATL